MSASAPRLRSLRGSMTRLKTGLAGALALALVWSLLWGGWHRAMHGGAPAHPAADATGLAAMHASAPSKADAGPGTKLWPGHDESGHEAGSDDCRLLDQASLGDALATALPVVGSPPPAPDTVPASSHLRIAVVDPLAYQARAPPRG